MCKLSCRIKALILEIGSGSMRGRNISCALFYAGQKTQNMMDVGGCSVAEHPPHSFEFTGAFSCRVRRARESFLTCLMALLQQIPACLTCLLLLRDRK